MWGELNGRSPGDVLMTARLHAELGDAVARAEAALVARDLPAIASFIPVREHWRLYRAFEQRAVFFDIEADGDAHAPTVVAALDAGGPHLFVAGRNLEALPELLGRSGVWVTFNGRVFDVPILARYFRELPRPAVHLDLKVLCARLGWNGGLKAIEERVGLARPPHLKDLNGARAIQLWRAHQGGSKEALALLAEYNLYDAVGLKALLDRAWNAACDECGFDEERVPPSDRSDWLYDMSKLVMVTATPS